MKTYKPLQQIPRGEIEQYNEIHCHKELLIPVKGEALEFVYPR